MKTLIVYHDHCADGLMSAAIANHYCTLSIKPSFLALSYLPGDKEKIEEWIEKELVKAGKAGNLLHIYILDYSIPPAYMSHLLETYPDLYITLIDHHKTAVDSYAKSSNIFSAATHPRATLILDVTKSGAGLTWEFFYPSITPIPLAVQLVQDRDLWHFKLTDTEAFHRYMVDVVGKQDLKLQLGTLGKLLMPSPTNYRIADALTEGYNLLHAYNEKIELIAYTMHDKNTYTVPLFSTVLRESGYYYWARLYCEYGYISDASSELLFNNPLFRVVVTPNVIDGNTLKLSFRSNKSHPDGGLDCAELAKNISPNGGGHRNAAGCTVALADIEEKHWQEIVHNEISLMERKVEDKGNITND